MKYLCVIQARISSSRLPAKIMLDLDGKTLIERVYQSVSLSNKISDIVVATSNHYSDDILVNKLMKLNIKYYRGSLSNVLERFYKVSEEYKAQNIVRITADNPLMDGLIIDKLIDIYESNNVDYSMFTNAVYGLSAEVFNSNILKEAYFNTKTPYEKEHVSPYIKENGIIYTPKIERKYNLPNLSITIDTLEDYIRMNNFYIFCSKNKLESNIDNFILYSNKYKKDEK